MAFRMNVDEKTGAPDDTASRAPFRLSPVFAKGSVIVTDSVEVVVMKAGAAGQVSVSADPTVATDDTVVARAKAVACCLIG